MTTVDHTTTSTTTSSTASSRQAPPAAIRTVDPFTLYAELSGDAGVSEVVVVDVGEGDTYIEGHISVAVPLPASEAELRIRRVAPRRSVPVVVTAPGPDDGPAEFVAASLQRLGYTDVRVLHGGNRAWQEAGYQLITGVNALSKALGEFVERHYDTPRVSVDELKSKIDGGDDLVILDTRPRDEYRFISIPGGIDAPGAELLYRAFDAVRSDRSEVVINCAGRTRAIIGAQALINAGFPNRVVSLENGTTAWTLAGLKAASGAAAEASEPTPEGLARAQEGAARIAEDFSVRYADTDRLAAYRAEAAATTLYLYDVRTEEEYRAGHLAGSRWAAGGQLVQTTDLYIGSRRGRIVLVDDASGVRATVTASWLLQAGFRDVSVYRLGDGDALVTTVEPDTWAEPPSDITAVTPEQVRDEIGHDRVLVVDVEPPAAPYLERPYIPGSVVAHRSTLRRNLGALRADLDRVIVTSGDGRLARIAAGELAAGDPPWETLVLDGGTAAWQRAGFDVQTGSEQLALSGADELPRTPAILDRQAQLDAYVAWGDVIVDTLARDGLVTFRSRADIAAELSATGRQARDDTPVGAR